MTNRNPASVPHFQSPSKLPFEDEENDAGRAPHNVKNDNNNMPQDDLREQAGDRAEPPPMEEEGQEIWASKLATNSSNRTEPYVSQLKDHFTLSTRSATIRYRDSTSAARVIAANDVQFILEETTRHPSASGEEDGSNHPEHNIEIRRIPDSTEGVQLLRVAYALVTAFWTGFLFVFCLQVILFAILDLAIESGATSKDKAHPGVAIGVLLSLPMLVYGLSSALVIASAYIVDTYNGHLLIRNFALRAVDPVLVEWVFFSCFLGFPILVLCVTLVSGNNSAWEITLLVWLLGVFAIFVVFCVRVLWYEGKACWEVSRHRYQDDTSQSVLGTLQRCLFLRQISTYGGRKDITYLSYGSIKDLEYTDKQSQSDRNEVQASTLQEHVSLYSKLTTHKIMNRCFQTFEPGSEERVYTIEDARDVRPFVTSDTWSLEKVFCRRKSSRYISVVRGPGALTPSQLKSSLMCSIIGTFLIVFCLFSLLMYLGMGVLFSMLIVAVGIILFLPTFKSAYRLYKFGAEVSLVQDEMNKELNAEEEKDDKEVSQALYFVKKVYRISKPSPLFCWIMFVLEITLFFLYPLSSLFRIANYPLGAIFFIVAGVTFCRYYINAAVVLEETGHMNVVDGDNEYDIWRHQSRLNEIVGNITRGRSRGVWMAVLGMLTLVFVALFVGAVSTSPDSLATFDDPFTYTMEYYYEATDSTRYPSCRISSELGGSPLESMADFAFLAGLAYRGQGDITDRELQGWFQDTPAIEEIETVATWRNDIARINSAVSFKLITFPDSNNYAYVLIRGTTNQWDMLTDAQLWAAAFLMQGLRELLPVGAMWTPAMSRLIATLSSIESESIDRVSFYRDTTAFVKYIQDGVREGRYAGVGITGHSLGGGLTLITAAQTGALGVGLSAPNAMLSRRSFDPPLTVEALDSKTFNIIPERDVVPMIDDRAQNTQSIRCETTPSDVIGCHDSTRSLCEILYSCGSGPADNRRPVLCECVSLYQYPEPLPVDPNNALAFSEFCEGLTAA